jgi:mono/diheme cytochrome c family protein
MIRGGGASMGRSPSMPPWGGELSDADIADVVAHLSTLDKKADLTC